MEENKIERIDKLMTELAKMTVKAEILFAKKEREIPYNLTDKEIKNLHK